MKLIVPREVTEERLEASSVPITEVEWTTGTYSTGDQRYVSTKLYEVVAATSTTDEPTAGALKDPPSWIEVGAINRFKMFDQVLGDATVSDTGTIDVTINPGSLVNSVALFELVGSSVQVTVTDPTDGEVYNRTISLTSTAGIDNWYSWFFAPIEQRREALFTDMPNYINASVRVIVQASSGSAKVGEVFLGRLQNLGLTLIDTEVGIEDFSRKERDSFGRFNVVEGRFAKLANWRVWLWNSKVQAVLDTLNSRRALPTVYIGDEAKPETVIVGFFRNYRAQRQAPDGTELSLEIEGLV